MSSIHPKKSMKVKVLQYKGGSCIIILFSYYRCKWVASSFYHYIGDAFYDWSL